MTDFDRSTRSVTPPWRILCALIVSGFLLGLPGGLLPLWRYHIQPDFHVAANYFMFLGVGLTAGATLAHRQQISVAKLLLAGCVVASLALLFLAFAAPPANAWLAAFALFLTGASAGVVNTAVFESIARAYEENPARIALTAGIFFGLGNMLAAYLMAQCLDAQNPGRILMTIAILPALAGAGLSRQSYPAASVTQTPLAETAKDLRSPLAILFALLLFFQFASEWSLAGWLPIFLVDRLGFSPYTAVSLLALYWLALTGGRVLTARLLHVISHGRLLAISAFCALFGCTALLLAGTRFGTVTGILLTGGGFSAIYPLAAERIAGRFTYYHPGYFNGIFTFALLGGILAPFVLGHAAEAWGLRVIPLAAIGSSCAVFALVLLIWLGHKVSGT